MLFKGDILWSTPGLIGLHVDYERPHRKSFINVYFYVEARGKIEEGAIMENNEERKKNTNRNLHAVYNQFMFSQGKNTGTQFLDIYLSFICKFLIV